MHNFKYVSGVFFGCFVKDILFLITRCQRGVVQKRKVPILAAVNCFRASFVIILVTIITESQEGGFYANSEEHAILFLVFACCCFLSLIVILETCGSIERQKLQKHSVAIFDPYHFFINSSILQKMI